MDATCGAGNACPSREPEFTPGFLGSYYSIFSFLSIGLHTIVCPFVLFLLSIVLSVLRFTASDYPFDIFKLFFLSSADYLYIRFNVGFFFLFFLNWFQFSFLFILFLPDCTSCISLHRGLFSAVVLLTVCFPLISNHCQCRSAIKEYMSSSPILSGVCVAQSLLFCVVFCRSFLSFCPFPFCVPIRYLHTFLKRILQIIFTSRKSFDTSK